jgi:hypothetical protein
MIQSLNPGVSNDSDGISLEESIELVEDQFIDENLVSDNEKENIFKLTYEKYFGLAIDSSEDLIEQEATEDATLSGFTYFIEAITELFDKYYGITITNTSLNINIFYDIYIFIYTMSVYYISKYIYSCLLTNFKTNLAINEHIASIKNSKETFYEALIEKYIGDENSFEFEDYLNLILTTDPGNDIVITLSSLIERGILNYDNEKFRNRLVLEASIGENQNAILQYIESFSNISQEKEIENV